MTLPRQPDPELNDSLADLLGGETSAEPRPMSEAAVTANYKPAEFFEKCRKCGGTGLYRGFSQHGRHCFACQGKGGKTFRTSPEQRAAKRQSALNKKVKAEAERREQAEKDVEVFKVTHPAEYAWLLARVDRFEVATSLWNKLRHYGSLTDGQLGAIQRMIEQDKVRAEEKAAREAAAPVADTAGVNRLKEAFDKAAAYAAEKGLKMRSPKITIAGTTISPAKATSSNPGALYVKSGGTYLGKITSGRFFASRECSDEQSAKVLAFIADPAQAAKAYGQTTGVCCVCNAELKSEWKHKGIGPICAEKFGWV